ncbi:hypothetical protein [Streptomyces sp. NBRC 110611]|uniref:hypothetical protein n=1 Tax=Streptomyces sp. NBRC 110611 TaxID=1621259 RepID=UPI0011BDB942|nr:hypothetical protein [Streptomyces sp. NBRC 110611]
MTGALAYRRQVSSFAREQHVGAPEARTEDALRLSASPDDIGHLVCCRALSWRTAFCGAEGDTINPAPELVCTMCVEQAEAMWPGILADPEAFCPVDGQPCPDEHEIDLRIAWETGPPAP